MNRLLKTLGWFFGRKNAQGFQVRYNEWGHETSVPAIDNYLGEEVEQPITRDQVKQWVKSLRSGLKQGSGSLKKEVKGDTCYCCLGVLAENMGSLREPDNDGVNKSEFFCDLTDQTSFGYLKVYTEDFSKRLSFYLPNSLQTKYANMNDLEGKTFGEIADEIERDFGFV